MEEQMKEALKKLIENATQTGEFVIDKAPEAIQQALLITFPSGIHQLLMIKHAPDLYILKQGMDLFT